MIYRIKIKHIDCLENDKKVKKKTNQWLFIKPQSSKIHNDTCRTNDNNNNNRMTNNW